MLFAETQLSETHRKQCMGEGSPSSALSYHYSALGDSPLRTRSFWLYRVTSHKGPSLSPSAGSFHAPAWVQRVKSTVNFILGWAQISFWFSSLENRQGPEHSGKTQPKLKHLSWKKLGTVKAPGTSCWEQEQVRNDGSQLQLLRVSASRRLRSWDTPPPLLHLLPRKNSCSAHE